jgi:mono/diheme cytochrome c family protein
MLRIQRTRFYNLAGILFCSTLLLSACSETEPGMSMSLLEVYMTDQSAIERGHSIFVGSCANYCHGDEPEQGEDVNLFDCQSSYGSSSEDIFRIVTTGIPNTRMVGFGNNFPEGQNDLWKLIAYIRTQQADCPTVVTEVIDEELVN